MSTGRVVVITGGASGMGRAIAQGFADAGEQIVIADINLEAATAVADDLIADGAVAEARQLDVTDAAACGAFIDQVHADFGSVDVLVNSAGIGQVKLLADVTEGDWDRMLGINTKGVFFLSQAAIGIMKQQGSGRIINIASIAGRRGEALVAPYCASKAAVISLTQAFAEEGAPDQVTVNAIAPGIVDTPFWVASDREFSEIFDTEPGEALARNVARVPLGRVEQPADVVPMALFLASEGDSYITGQSINVDGGINFA
ncbi:MAG: SDR family NAD(P)-dependent oxidoreductase, partial [Beutenbergiaceae bacterium]